jgi:beta-lactam-binding protein with PASTA domain
MIKNYKMFPFITQRPFWMNLLAGLILMVVLLFLLSIVLGPCTRHGKNKTVPNVVGKSFEEAKKILDDNGFDVEVSDSIYTDTTAKGSVLRQIPDGDAIVKISRTVYLTINRHVPPVVEMPNIVGFSLRNAELQLKNMGLKIGDTAYVADFAKNSVKEQHYHKGGPIPPGTKISQGSSIDLVLSNGVGETDFTVPNLIGMTYGAAKNLLESNGLNFLVVLPDPEVIDSANAYIYWQRPSRMGEDGKRIKIRSGQTMDVRLSVERPAIDTLVQNLPQQ